MTYAGARRRRSVRWRAAAAAVLALAPALLVVSVLGVLFQRHQLTGGVESVGRERAASVGQELRAADGPASATLASVGGESGLFQVVGRTDDVQAASPALTGRPALVGTGARARIRGLVAGEADDYLAVRVDIGDGRSVVAAQSLEGVDDATGSTWRLLAVGDPLLVLLVAGLSYLLVGRALRPVDALRAEASRITAADLSARLPETATGDEVERLAVTLNQMLARLETSADAQRRFVADASHELRSPVATIRTLHEVAGALDPASDWPSVSREVLAETGRLERLVADLLLLARPRATRLDVVEPLDLSALVLQEVSRARRVPVEHDVVPGVVVPGHRDSLARALRNLLDNAERHAHAGVLVALSTRGGVAVLTVRDDGDGIAESDRERIFERFVRLDEARTRDTGGSGLGLSITRHLVQSHGGSVRVTDAPGGGVLVVELPLERVGAAGA